MRNYVQYSENLNGIPTFFIFLSLMLIFGSMVLWKLECMRGVERRKLKTKLNWRALEAAPSLCMEYFSNLVNCICPELSSVFLAVSIFWEEEPNWIGEARHIYDWKLSSSDGPPAVKPCSIFQNWSTVFLLSNWVYFSPSRFNTCKEESQTEIELDNMEGFAIAANEKFVQVTDRQPATALRKC